VSLDHEHDAHSGSVGVNGTFKQNTNDTDETGVVPLLPDFQQLSGGIFVLEKWKNHKWILEAGARYDYQHLHVFTFMNNQVLVSLGLVSATFLVR
jgi:iron complex outermembrane receptor protein